MRIVLDTNVLVSGVISRGLPRRLLERAIAREFELCTSEVLLTELEEVLGRRKFAVRLSEAGLSPKGLVEDIRRIAFVVAPTEVPRVIEADPDDDHVLAAAVESNANLVASGDKRHLLPLDNYQGILILTASEVDARLEAARLATSGGNQ